MNGGLILTLSPRSGTGQPYYSRCTSALTPFPVASRENDTVELSQLLHVFFMFSY